MIKASIIYRPPILHKKAPATGQLHTAPISADCGVEGVAGHQNERLAAGTKKARTKRANQHLLDLLLWVPLRLQWHRFLRPG